MQTVKGKSPKTVEEYYLDLRTFFRYIKHQKRLADKNLQLNEIDISDINIELIKTISLIDIFEYMNYLATERENHASARSRKVSSLRSFFKYLTNKTEELDVNPAQELETPKQNRVLPKFLTLEQSKDLLGAVVSYNSEYMKRDYCIVTLFLNCGMRLSELVGININDINENGTVKIKGKGDKERIIYINEACKKAIGDYKKTRPNDNIKDRKAFFISRQNNRISAKTVQYLMGKYLKLAGLNGFGYSTHKLRHTAATLMYQYGGPDIRVLKDILGHENLGTTEIYTHLSSKQIKDAIESNPLAKIQAKK